MQTTQRPMIGGIGITGSTLKIIAIVTMFIDHIGAVIVERWLIYDAYASQTYQYNPRILLLDQILRSVGRIAFPVFCFLLVEGFSHTRNVWKYGLRLGSFALVSEVPFNLAIAGEVWSAEYQNVFFTLLIGLGVMISCEGIRKWSVGSGYTWPGRLVKGILCLAALAAGMICAEYLCTDYGARGVLSIGVIYLLRGSSLWQTLGGAATFYWELPAPVAFLPIAAYNGKRGLKMKYLFYIFYPVHLLLLYGVACFMGIA